MVGEVPRFPEFCDLALEFGGEVGDALRRLGPEVAEFTFANLYLFRRAHRYRLSRLDGLLLVLGEGYDGVPYAFPPLGPGDVGQAVELLGDRLRAEGAEPVFFPVPGPLVAARFSAPRWQATPDRDQADYLYLRSDLAELPGPRFHKRKNRLQKFLREEGDGYAYAELADEHVPQCAELAGGWCELRCAPERPSTYQETEAAREALAHRRALGLSGGVILLGGRVRAFCLGEELNPETFVVHFEKAEPGLEGLAQVINRDFCRHSLGRYRYVNREQDLGDPGLRRAKEAYHPVRLVEKFRVRPAVRP